MGFAHGGGTEEGGGGWEELFINIKNRGVKNVGLIVADGINGLEEVIHLLFPKAKFQKCVVHKQRQILRKTRAKDKAEMASDLKYLFDNFGENATREKALEKLKNFCEKWESKYPKIENYFNDRWS